jgi:UDP-glucuronate 4-epimerase
MKSTLISGGAGFIGSHLVQRFLAARNEHLLIIDNFNSYYDPALKRANAELVATPRVTLVEADVCDADAMVRILEQHQVHVIVHLAASPGVPASRQQPLANVRNNVLGTISLLEAARKQAVEHFLFASSSTVYGQGASEPFAEDAPLGIPLSPYGASKRSCELLGLMYDKLHRLPFTALRLFNVYGPRLRPELALAAFTRAILADQPITLYGDGSVSRDFTHVSDICTGFLAALGQKAAFGQCINLGSDRPITMIELIRLLEETTGRTAQIDFRPARTEDMPLTHADLSKARKLLAYEPRVALRDGVADYVRWFQREFSPNQRN